MCDVCNLLGKDTKMVNGEKIRVTTKKLKTYKAGGRSSVSLCYIHEQEFFIQGERRFMSKYYNVVTNLYDQEARRNYLESAAAAKGGLL